MLAIEARVPPLADSKLLVTHILDSCFLLPTPISDETLKWYFGNPLCISPDFPTAMPTTQMVLIVFLKHPICRSLGILSLGCSYVDPGGKEDHVNDSSLKGD